MKKSGRRLLGILLAASMTAAAVFPVQGMAAEGTNRRYAYEEEEIDLGERVAEEPEEEQKTPEEGKDLEEGEPEESKALEEEEPEEDNIPQEEGQQPSKILSQEPEEKGVEDLLPKSNDEETIMPLEDSYDINQPVIEKFEFVENGKTLTQTEELHFNIWVYDADSYVQSISIVLSGSHFYDKALSFQKSEEGNLYTATLPCSQMWEGSYYVDSIRVEDARNNYVEKNVYGEGGYYYEFILKNPEETHNVTLSNFQMVKSAADGKETLKAEDEVTFTADVQCENEKISSVYMYVSTYQSSYSGTEQIVGEYDEDSNSLTGVFKVTDKTCPTVWRLGSIHIRTEAGRYYYIYPESIEPEKELMFEVDQEYDNDKPVIESIAIDKNGQTVNVGETITIRVKVEEEHPSASACVRFHTKASGGVTTASVYLSYDENSKEYVGETTVTKYNYPGKWELSYLEIADTYGNYAYLSDYQGAGEEDALPYYMVSADAYDMVDPIIKSICIDHGELAKAGERVAITVEVEEENPYSTAEARFEAQDSENADSMSVGLRYRTDLKAYVGTIDITETTGPYKWELAYLCIRDNNGNKTYLWDYEEDGPWYFTVDPAGYDVENPVIESITIDKNGEWVKAGDTVTIRVKVNEKNPSNLGHAYFYPQVTNVSAYSDVDLWYDSASKEYVGTIHITDTTYPCEWMLTELEITDTSGRKTDLYDFQSNWRDSCPWYYRVKSGNTYREDMKDVMFSFYGYAKQADGSYQPDSLISRQTVEKVGRRATLKELGVFPQPIEGVAATWTYNWTDWEVDENTELLFPGTETTACNFFAAYDKGCANVSLTYMAEDSGQKTVIVPCFVDREATYQDVLDTLELPEDGKADDFVRFKLGYSNEYHNEETQVGDVAGVSVEAEYKKCQVAWNTRYVDKDGIEISQVITKSYLEGTTIKEALAELKEPEDINGMEFERWILLDTTEDEILSQPMTSLNVVAIYSGKTTVDTTYTYRGEDGIITCGSKLLVLDGEGLSDAAIQGQATAVVKDVSHLAGLMLYEWSDTIDINQEKYKKIQFQALYYNCVVVLKYPDETCQYVIVDKNAEFTLPTENENYEDIVWEGCEKGQTVVITEDREFLAEDAKRKDGAIEETTGARLSEEEIARIKEEIEKAESGASIQIDMKKATVVPKELLEKIKEKQVELVLDMGAYSWSISGKDVVATELEDIDLEVTIGTDHVPSSLIDSIAEGKSATQISLTHNGAFGFRADLTLNLGSENSGSTANLYYYDSSGKLIFRNAGQVGEDGATSLSFSHASDYVVVIDKNASSNAEPKDEETGKPENNAKEDDGKQDDSEEDTGRPDGKVKEKNGKQRDGDTKEEVWNNHKENETANVRRNSDHTTTDSGKTEVSTADSNKMKSPKTGE